MLNIILRKLPSPHEEVSVMSQCGSDYSVAIVRSVLWRDLKMHGHVFITFCIQLFMQSLLFSKIDGILPLYILPSTEQS